MQKKPSIRRVQELEKEGKLPVRYEATHHVYMPRQKDDAVKVLLDFRKKYGGDLLKFNTIEIHYDGVAEINTAALLEDFNNEPGNKGGVLLEENELKDLLLEMAPHKLNLHTVGDRSIRTALNAMEAAQKAYGGKLPVELTLSHLQVVHPDDIKCFKQLGVHANFTPHWLGSAVAGSHNHETLSEERILHTQLVKSFINAGANATFSRDVVVAPAIHFWAFKLVSHVKNHRLTMMPTSMVWLVKELHWMKC